MQTTAIASMRLCVTVRRRQQSGKTDDDGSAHAALPADALTRTYVVYRESREEPLMAVPG